MSNSLEERLRANSSAFDGLLELIPAKYYYDENTQDQWKAKKKSKEQARDDKMKKLDPTLQNDDVSSALDIMKKREVDAKPVVLPGERMKAMKKTKQQQDSKKDVNDESEEVEAEDIKVIFDDEGNEIRDNDNDDDQSDGSVSEPESETKVQSESESAEPKFETEGERHAAIKQAKIAERKKLTDEERAKKQKNLEVLRSKLQSKIQDMKTKRKAPGSKADGAPVSREAILKQRKHKLELKSKKIQQEDEESDSDGSDDDEVDEKEQPNKKKTKTDKYSDINADGVIFQSIVFDDGVKATSDLQRLRKMVKKKGPAKNDIKGHLKLLEAKKAKLESKDELDQIKSKVKDKWQRTMLQTEGIKIKDDEKLLRKALKKKEAKKRKSAVEWGERKRVVTDTKAERVKRREENLKIRKENRGVKRSKQQKMKRKFKGIITPKKRAGFEGKRR